MAGKRIGVLALQGGFAKHVETLQRLGQPTVEVRRAHDLTFCSSLILPGGESTTMQRQIDFLNMRSELIAFIETHPTFATCAGLILLSSAGYGLLDVDVERNGFGRQIASCVKDVALHLPKQSKHPYPAIFIRAPRITRVGPEVQTLGSFDNEPALVQQGHILAASFHPELTEDDRIHNYFLSKRALREKMTIVNI